METKNYNDFFPWNQISFDDFFLSSSQKFEKDLVWNYKIGFYFVYLIFHTS